LFASVMMMSRLRRKGEGEEDRERESARKVSMMMVLSDINDTSDHE
jgi:hypothetical protein